MTNIFMGHFSHVLIELLKKIKIDLVLVEDKQTNKKIIKICQKNKIKYLLVNHNKDISKATRNFKKINLCFVASFSLILKKNFINKCKHIINFHLGDVNICRGRHPLPTTILNGHKSMGITVHLIDSEKIDAGPILAKIILPIDYHKSYKINEKVLLQALEPLTCFLIDGYLKKGGFVSYQWCLKSSSYFKPLEKEVLSKIIEAPNLRKFLK